MENNKKFFSLCEGWLISSQHWRTRLAVCFPSFNLLSLLTRSVPRTSYLVFMVFRNFFHTKTIWRQILPADELSRFYRKSKISLRIYSLTSKITRKRDNSFYGVLSSVPKTSYLVGDGHVEELDYFKNNFFLHHNPIF